MQINIKHFGNGVDGCRFERAGANFFEDLERKYFSIIGLPHVDILRGLRFVGASEE